MSRFSILAAFALLAACGSEQEQETPAPLGNALAEMTNDAVAQENDAAPANVQAPLPAPAEATIPEPIRGRWGLVAEDCTSTRGDAKGLLEITDTLLRFYESRGTLTQIVERDESRIVADFAFTGEGQNWTRRMVLDAQDEGRVLIRREQGVDAMAGALRYEKCEA